MIHLKTVIQYCTLLNNIRESSLITATYVIRQQKNEFRNLDSFLFETELWGLRFVILFAISVYINFNLSLYLQNLNT